MFRASSVPIIRSYQLYKWQLICFMQVMWPLLTTVRFQPDNVIKKDTLALRRQIGRCRLRSFLRPHSQPVPKCLNGLWQVKENLLSRLPTNNSPVLNCFHTSFSVVTLAFQSAFKCLRFQNAYFVRFKYLSNFPLGKLQYSA